MNMMTFAGRRGEIRWGKRGIQYDAFLVKFGLLVPFALGELVHAWDFSTSGSGTCKAITLRPNAALKKRVLIADWTLMGGIFVLVVCMRIWSTLPAALGAVGLFLSLAMIVVGAVMMLREDARLRQIRLALGTHAWGSSDPATWGKSIRRDVVDPQVGFGEESFADLAEKAMADEDWCKAMWAARICVAVEDAKTGEELTDAILDEHDVQDRIRWVRRHPLEHKKEFGKAPPLREWLTCDPSVHIFEVS